MANRNDYAIFLQRQTGGVGELYRLPVNPEKLPEGQDDQNEEYNVLSLGPVTVPRTPGPRKVTIESYFPGRVDRLTLTSGNFLEPEVYINLFRNARMNKEVLIYTPVRYYEDGEPFFTGDTGFPVLVSNFETEERGGETGDFYYTLELTEYKDYSPLKVQLQEAATANTPAVATTDAQRSIPAGQIVVGMNAILNGPYYYSSYGDEPHGNGDGLSVTVSRIVTNDDSRAYPIHVNGENGGALGWCKESSLQVIP